MEPPSAPFVVVPGELSLYHEWGHHVDHVWSHGDQEVLFSFRWLSRFYELGVASCRPRPAGAALQPIVTMGDACDAVRLWWKVSSELFAELFEQWMRGTKKVAWDIADPAHLMLPHDGACSPVGVAFLSPFASEDVHSQTNALFAGGLGSVSALPALRGDLFGAQTAKVVASLRAVVRDLREG